MYHFEFSNRKFNCLIYLHRRAIWCNCKFVLISYFAAFQLNVYFICNTKLNATLFIQKQRHYLHISISAPFHSMIDRDMKVGNFAVKDLLPCWHNNQTNKQTNERFVSQTFACRHIWRCLSAAFARMIIAPLLFDR